MMRPSQGRDWTTALVLDREHTIAFANEHFEALMPFAESPSTREPPRRARFSRERFGWWLYDAGGKLMLEALLLDLAPALRDIEKQDADVEAASAPQPDLRGGEVGRLGEPNSFLAARSGELLCLEAVLARRPDLPVDLDSDTAQLPERGADDADEALAVR